MELPINYNEAHWLVRKHAREEYARRQNGLCCHCGRPLDKEPNRDKPINKRVFPKNFFKWPVHLHHDHDSGMTIGAIHNYCNAVLWQYHSK